MSKMAINPSQTGKMHIRRNDIAQLFINIYVRIFYTFRLSSVSLIQDAKISTRVMSQASSKLNYTLIKNNET